MCKTLRNARIVMRFMKLQDQIWQNQFFVLFCLKRFLVAHILITSFYEKAFVYDFIITECYSHSTKGIWSTTPTLCFPQFLGLIFRNSLGFLEQNHNETANKSAAKGRSNTEFLFQQWVGVLDSFTFWQDLSSKPA